MNGNEIQKFVHSGELTNVPKFIIGDFVIFVADFTTLGIGEPQELIWPKGTKGVVVSNRDGEFGVAVYGDRRWVGDGDGIITRFEPDAFDRAWLTGNYTECRALYDARTTQS